MEELIRLKNNIKKLIDIGYPDESVDILLENSVNLETFNWLIEEELSCYADSI